MRVSEIVGLELGNGYLNDKRQSHCQSRPKLELTESLGGQYITWQFDFRSMISQLLKVTFRFKIHSETVEKVQIWPFYQFRM